MKERKRRGVILICNRDHSEGVGRRSGELAVAVIIEHFLQICPSARDAIEISIAFAKREVSVRSARTSRIILQVFLVFRNRQIVKLASEQAIGVLELTPVSPLGFARWQLCRAFL